MWRFHYVDMIDDVTAIPPAVEGEPGPAVPVLKPALVFLVTSPIPQLSRGPQILAAFEQRKLLALRNFREFGISVSGAKINFLNYITAVL